MQVLSRQEFDILEVLTIQKAPISQRRIVELTNYSLSTINRKLKEMSEKGYISNGRINGLGLMLMEKYRVKRAVFIAAGFGSRLVPVTLNTPKPLIRVHGKRIIDGLIDAALKAEIEEIIVVRGYLSEQFDQLLYKYPMIRFFENPVFNEANNISSSMCVRDFLCNAYVFEADLILSNPNLIKKYQFSSNFLGIPKERSDDWCFKVKDGLIIEQQIGGYHCHQMVGISYWDEKDGKKLAEHIKMAYAMPGGSQLYWEQVPLKIYKNEYKVEIRECAEEDVMEIDTFRELKEIDKVYNVQ